MSVADHVFAQLTALFISALMIIACLRCAAADEMPLPSSSSSGSRFSLLEELNFSGFQTRGSSYVFILLAGLLLVTTVSTSRSKRRQRLVSDIPIVGGSDGQCVKENRKRFIHDGKAMIEEGYRQVRLNLHTPFLSFSRETKKYIIES